MKQKTVETAQQDLGSDSGDEALIIVVGTKGTLTPRINSESHEGTSSVMSPFLLTERELNCFISELL